ncbi:MAG: hypothetical protein WCK02_15340 [Bacteroidota bacterium]
MKPIQNGIHEVFKNIKLSTYTAIVDDNFINNLNDEFAPTCFQEEIIKTVEIRTFYLDKKTYSMAIFSQSDQTTSVDFRNYNYKKPNRTMPFNLPISINDKLILFMNKVGLNCGSFDLIYTPNKDFYFLEINPVGQYGMVSHPCNYYLDKVIADYLIK